MSFVFVNGDAQARLGGQRPVAIFNRRQGFGQELGVFVVAALLGEEIGDGTGNLQAGGQRAGALGVMGAPEGYSRTRPYRR